jgi:hypothetical protein
MIHIPLTECQKKIKTRDSVRRENARNHYGTADGALQIYG